MKNHIRIFIVAISLFFFSSSAFSQLLQDEEKPEKKPEISSPEAVDEKEVAEEISEEKTPVEKTEEKAEEKKTARENPIPHGTWVFVPQGSDNIETSIEEATSHMNFIVRRVASARLKGANKHIQRLVITYPGDEVHISLQSDEPTVITPRTGEVVPYTREDGEVVRANSELKPGQIRHFFDSDDGQKEMIYRLRPDGILALETTVFSERLREPFRYTWLYRLTD